VEQRTLNRRSHDGAVDVGRGSSGGKSVVRCASDRARVCADALDGVARGRLPHDHAQHVQSVQLTLTARERVLTSALQDLLRACAQEAAEVDRPLRACPLTREVPREELVERAAGGSGVFRH